MRATPTWFGPPGRRLFGYVHIPEDGRPGASWSCADRSGARRPTPCRPSRRSPTSSPVAGVAALRFAYAGTGDSAGNFDDPGRMSDWLASIDEAVSFARRSTDGPVVLLGMRMGALLAIEAVARGTSVDHLVVWDPCASGREFLRVERTLLATGYGATQVGDGSVTGPAFIYSAETVEELSALDAGLRRLLHGPTAALVAVRSEGRGAAGRRDDSSAPTSIGSRWTGSPICWTSRPR